jgi:hypothetical protein
VYYWEIVIMGRKVALTTVAVALAPAGLDIQVIVAVTVLFSAALLHTSVKPYKMPILNRCELLSLVVAFMTLVGGLLLDSPRVTGNVKQGVTVLLVLQNVLLLVYFLVVLLGDMARVTHAALVEYVELKQEQQAKAERGEPGVRGLSPRTLKFVNWVIATEARRLVCVRNVRRVQAMCRVGYKPRAGKQAADKAKARKPTLSWKPQVKEMTTASVSV